MIAQEPGVRVGAENFDEEEKFAVLIRIFKKMGAPGRRAFQAEGVVWRSCRMDVGGMAEGQSEWREGHQRREGRVGWGQMVWGLVGPCEDFLSFSEENREMSEGVAPESDVA